MPTKAPRYQPEPGSVPDRVLQLVLRNPGDEWTSSDLALKYQVPATRFKALLQAAVDVGLLTHQREPADLHPHWRAGPQLAAWASELPAAAPALGTATTGATTLAAAPQAGTTTSTGKRASPVRDLRHVPVISNRPVPAARAAASPYAELWNRMNPGDCVELPERNAYGLVAHVKKRKGKACVRSAGTGMKCVWRAA